MFHLYKWTDLKESSPHEQVRNRWLFRFGAFGRLNGLWFPCRVTKFNTIGEPACVLAIPLATTDMGIYPKGEILVNNMEVLYSTFADGMSIEAYIGAAMSRKRMTDKMLNGAIRRSLNTELLFSPKQIMKQVKKAANREDKEEAFVLDVTHKDMVGAINLPLTADIIEKLWNSNDWALQEISQLLGISYNPSHGKKERMLQQELLGDRDLTIMNREMITSRLITAAEKFGEHVCHISSEIDSVDRNLSYGTDKVRQENEVE